MRPSGVRATLAAIVLASCHSGSPLSGRVALDSSVAALQVLRRTSPRLYDASMTASILMAQAGLNLLGFGPGRYTGELDAATRDATRRYEAARGLPITGNPFAATTYPRLQADAERLQRIAAPWANRRHFDTTDWSERVEADGPWVSPGVENPAAVTVECDRDEMQCTMAETEYGSRGAAPSLDWYDVATWDAAEIRTEPSDDRCQRSVLVLNRIEASVILTRTLLSDDSACIEIQQDTSSAYDRSAHLASDSELAAIRLRATDVAFDTLLHLPRALRRSLAPLTDTAAMGPRP
jgi:Putative peptidoglycan binding domain